ncbi:hypothetical protein PENTCL1PPCAC_11652, partial [Pristionchus entomophagus]
IGVFQLVVITLTKGTAMSVSSQSDQGRRGRSQTAVDETLLPPFVHQLDTKIKDYEREGDIEFPFEDTTGAGDENRMRGNWSSRTDSLLAIAGFTFGLGNIWRFPFLVYKHGGVAFLIPFSVCLFVAAIPVFFLEVSLGQFSSVAAISVWKAVPLFKGIGISSVYLSCVLSIYLAVTESWTLFYLIESIGFSLPWSNCTNSWSGKNCSAPARIACNLTNGTLLLNGSCLSLVDGSITNQTTLKSLEYFHESVLMKSNSIEEFAPLNWYLGICLMIIWSAVFLCLFQGVKSSGKVVYVVVVLPYIILAVLLVRLLTLEGSLSAVIHFMYPDFSVLRDLKVWGEAAIHAFYSLSCCTGGLITLASYNRFHSNLLRDVWLIPLLDILCSISACILTFSAIGFTCRLIGVDITHFQLRDGAHLLFVFLSEALSQLPAAPLYAALFFLMLALIINSTLVSLIFDTWGSISVVNSAMHCCSSSSLYLSSFQLFVVETVISSLCDHFAELLRKCRRHVLAVSCIILALLSLPFCSSAGLYWLAILDRYVLRWPLIILAFLEVTAMGWVYGVDNLLDNIKWMTGKYPPVYLFWKMLWKYVCPVVYMLILSFVWQEWEILTYETYSFPYWTSLVGWGLSLVPLIIIIVAGVEELVGARGTFSQRWSSVLNPDDSWGPALAIHRAEHFPLQIPEARRLLITCEDDLPPSEKEWQESHGGLNAHSHENGFSGRISTDRMSHAATIASVPAFERETAI